MGKYYLAIDIGASSGRHILGHVEEGKLVLKVQIIDKYLGNFFAIFSFRDGGACVHISKTAEDFLHEYYGWINAKAE